MLFGAAIAIAAVIFTVGSFIGAILMILFDFNPFDDERLR